MDELTRRAMLGDREAQEELTKQGKLMPCQCGGEAKVIQRLTEDCHWLHYLVICKKCGKTGGLHLSRKEAVKEWNSQDRKTYCPHCDNRNRIPKEGATHDFRVMGNGLFYFDLQLGWEGVTINFCPWCGRDLTKEE